MAARCGWLPGCRCGRPGQGLRRLGFRVSGWWGLFARDCAAEVVSGAALAVLARSFRCRRGRLPLPGTGKDRKGRHAGSGRCGGVAGVVPGLTARVPDPWLRLPPNASLGAAHHRALGRKGRDTQQVRRSGHMGTPGATHRGGGYVIPETGRPTIDSRGGRQGDPFNMLAGAKNSKGEFKGSDQCGMPMMRSRAPLRSSTPAT